MYFFPDDFTIWLFNKLGPLRKADSGNSMLLCKSCLRLKECRPIPAQTADAIHSGGQRRSELISKWKADRYASFFPFVVHICFMSSG